MQFIKTEVEDPATSRSIYSDEQPTYRHYLWISLVLAACMLVTVPAFADPPNTDAGPDQSVDEQTNVQLDGSGTTHAGAFSYAWAQIAGTSVSLSNSSIANPTFTAPVRLVSQGSEVLTFRLTATDTVTAEFSTDTVNITVNPVNSNPNANAGPNQSVNEQSNVNLNGNGSSDPDGPIASFAWVQQQGTAVGLSGANTATPSFTAPTRTAQQGAETLRFQLTVTDGDGISDSDTVDITVNPVNADPVANAGPDQTVNENSPVSLDGTGSSDSDGSISTYAWVQTAGPGVTLSGAGTAAPTFTSPDLPGNSSDFLVFQLTVTDNEGATDSDTVRIDVDQVNVAPTITGQNPVSTPEETAVTITLGDLVVNDPDDTYPDDFTLAVQNGANYVRNGATITPVADFVGNLSVPVTVNDGLANSNVFNLVVEVTPVNDDPEITGQQPLSTDEDTSLTVVIGNLTVIDPDTPPAQLTLSLQTGANYTLSGNTVTPDPNFNGRLTVGATVSDGIGTSPVFPLRIDINSVNDLPVLVAPIGGQNAVESSNFNLNISLNFDDADNEDLDFTASGLPPSGNISFNTNTGVFNGTPQFEDTTPAVYNITVTARDGAGEVASDNFTLTIAALDRANVSLDITVAPNPAMAADELQWTFTARNPVGPQAAAGLELIGSFFGSGLTVTSTDPCTIDAPSGGSTNFDCTIGGLPVGGSATIVIRTLTSEPGDVTAFAIARGMDPVPIDPNPDDNDDQTAVGVAEVFSNGAVQVLGNSGVLSIAAGDLNGDSAADLVVGTAAGQPVRVHLSDGFRSFSVVPISLPDSMSNEGVALADFDNNGTLDIVVANGGGQVDTVYGNNGAASFSAMATLNASFAQDVGVGDFDDDGNSDIVIATIDDNLVYFGNGNGTFDAPVTVGNSNTHGVAVARMNSDSRDDIVFANVGSASEVWTKNNSGTGFSRRDQMNIGDATSVAIADLGGSSRADLLFGRIAGDVGDIPANVILINDGSGRFGNPSERLGNAPTFDVLIGDVNSDGMLDLVFLNESGVHQIWNSNGGGYALHSEQIVADGARAGVLTELGFTDVNEPGGVDLAMGGVVQLGAGVYLNDGFGNLGRGDAVPPMLTLNGADPLDVPSNTAFVDPGATATDNIDGDISGSVSVMNPVNTAVVGSYTVTYNVSDFAGNAAVPITRTVNVIPSAGSGGSGGGGAIGYLMMLLLAASTIMSRRGPCARATASSKGTRQ